MSATPDVERSAKILRVLPVLGLVALALFALAWNDILPGGFALRELVEPDRARELRERARHAAERMHTFASENAHVAEGSIVFVGSSTIERFPLVECFPGKPCLNRGIASESARELADRLARRLPRERPAGVVLYTGAIDWREEGQSASLVAERVGAVLDRISKLLPGVPIVLLGILPERNMDPAAVSRLAQANAALATLASERGVRFVSTSRIPITSPQGSLAEEFSQDTFHLDVEGYRHLARRILEEGGEVGRSLAP